MPQVFTGDNYAWKNMLEIKGGLDGVIIATPWEWHKPMVMGSLEAGLKYVATEVILGIHVAGSLGCSEGCGKIQCQCDDAWKMFVIAEM